MDYKIAYISNKKDLKKSLVNSTGQIAITEQKLAERILTLKNTGNFKIVFAVFLIIISLLNFFNVVGWITAITTFYLFGYTLLSDIGFACFSIGFKNIYKILYKYKVSNLIEPEAEMFDEKIHKL